MFGWTRIATLAAVAAVLAIATGVAGATSNPGSVPAGGSHMASAGKISTAAASRAALLKAANLRTRAGAARYLRSIGLNASHLVIQRGIRNYAGANCPGKGWSCTSTAHPVVQIASAGGSNTFQCATASCAVVQATTAAPASPKPATNKATCVKTTGPTQDCVINQTSPTANNVAIVVETSKTSGLTQTGTYTAEVTQHGTGPSNTNTACVLQNINVDGSTTAKKGASVNVALNVHQSVTISQDSVGGSNTVQAAMLSDDCGAANSALTQSQTLTSGATGSGSITQNENAAGSDANVKLDIAQNSTSGVNTSAFTQTNALTAIANTPLGPVSQTQSTTTGGIQASVNQSSQGLSTASATQTETQCEDAAASGLTACSTSAQDPPSYSPTQVQHGPVRKDTGSTQTGNSNDTFTINQSSTQSNDTGEDQTNEVQGACTTSGNCTVSQTTTVNGETTTNTQSGQNVDTTTSCSYSTCTPTPPPAPVIDSGPTQPSTTSTDATFAFHDADTSATFQCKLETDLTYTPCTSPKSYTGLPDGQHTFSVEAVNPSNGTVSDPATYTWTITTANTDLITNGSFEADTFSYYGTLDLGSSSNPLTGWTTLMSGAYPWGLPYPNTFNAGPTPYGNQWVIVGNECDQGTSWIEQTINTTAGQSYTLSFALASEYGGSGAQVVVSFPTGSSTASQTFTAPPRVTNYWDTWATSSMDFTADSASATIRFTSVPVSVSDGCDAGIDNVSVTAAQTIG